MRAWLARLINSHDPTVDLLPILLGLYFVLAVLGVAAFIYLSLYAVHTLHQDWHPEGYGQGIGLVFAGTGLLAFLHAWKWPGGGDPPQGGT